jgi:hypothetical protein
MIRVPDNVAIFLGFGIGHIKKWKGSIGIFYEFYLSFDIFSLSYFLSYMDI